MTIQSEEQWFALVDALHSAALGEETWETALRGLAHATGSRSSQLIGRTCDLTVLFNVMTNIDPAIEELLVDRQPINPRPPAVRNAPLLQPIADWDVLSPQESRHSAFYEEVLRPADMPFFCATVLEKRNDAFITLGVIRSSADGYITAEQRHTFSLLAQQARAALRLHAALEGKGAALLAGAMDALAIPLFLCDSTGGVRLLTPAAEALIASGSGLRLTDGTLRATSPGEDRALQDAIGAALPRNRTSGSPASRTVIVHNGQPGVAPVVLDIFALPRQRSVLSLAGSAAQVLIVACGQRKADSRREAILAAVYGLTSAETQVAQLLAAGRSAQSIADERCVSVGTVRGQISTILSKLGVRRQAELAARVHQL